MQALLGSKKRNRPLLEGGRIIRLYTLEIERTLRSDGRFVPGAGLFAVRAYTLSWPCALEIRSAHQAFPSLRFVFTVRLRFLILARIAHCSIHMIMIDHSSRHYIAQPILKNHCHIHKSDRKFTHGLQSKLCVWCKALESKPESKHLKMTVFCRCDKVHQPKTTNNASPL